MVLKILWSVRVKKMKATSESPIVILPMTQAGRLTFIIFRVGMATYSRQWQSLLVYIYQNRYSSISVHGQEMTSYDKIKQTVNRYRIDINY